MEKSKFPMVLQVLRPWFDVVALMLWGILFLNYWFSGKLNLLIHPNYHLLTLVAALFLMGLAGWKSWELWQRRKSARSTPEAQHMALLPTGWGSFILIGVALLGFIVTPRAFGSETALQRGVNDTFLATTQVKPQSFKGTTKPENRSLIEWMRALQLYPEPDAYAGQPVKIDGFAVHPDKLPDQYFLLTRFTITCCAADAYPVSLPIKLRQGDRSSYKVDQWFEVKGVMITETLAAGNRQVVVDATEIRPIKEPKNPYNY
ncbi:TIGR03943 family protein [filamentous cyanobacterium LEGE 11480]|uniref:TIGR03943 family protein n=1 Tax=Romeriopsis navalis LEGE 11480 TaxID=2777977 RepID=A0A928VPB4_9CYAN|nr:TIGR03943 family protein [Romeriopsis navalis]MBE9031995.1 TIGR03943 family protein [Romeriopsis navalis LEGE 11480]